MELSTNNSNLFISNHFYKVFKTITDKKAKNESIASEIEWLNSQLMSENRKFCENACLSIVLFGKKHDFGFALNALISAFSRIKNDNFDLLTDAMMDLLLKNLNECQNFQILEKPHPLILLLKEVETTKLMYLSIKIDDVFNSSNKYVKENCIKFLHPVLLTILCSNVIYPESRNIWRTIVENGNKDFIQEIISLRRVTSSASCILFNSMIILKMTFNYNLESVLLLISSTKRMAEYSLDVTTNIKIIKEHTNIIESEPNSSNLVLLILAEILHICSIKYIPILVSLLDHLIVNLNFGHIIILHMILDGLINTLAYPSFMTKEMQIIEKLVNYIRGKKFIKNPVKQTKTINLSIDFVQGDKHLLNAYNICTYIETNQQLQIRDSLYEHEKFFWNKNHLVLRGIFHAIYLENSDYKLWKNVLKNLIEISKSSNETMKSSLVMPLLFCLAESFDPKVKVCVLQHLTELGASSEIFNTIKALSTGMLRSMTIDLYVRLWKIEPRVYPFLHKSLVEKSSLDEEDTFLKIIRIAAIKEICDLKPHHGSDLVSLISQILNESIDSKNDDVSAALSIDSISLLCQNHIISVTSTWKAISLSTRYEKRPRVIKSLCNFLSNIPQFRRNNQEFEIFNKEIVNRLFHMIEWGETYSIQCALIALQSWNYDLFTLDMIPDTYRENIPLPQPAPGMEVSILDLEVPGECYVQLLTKIDVNARKTAGELISHYIKQEIAEYRSGNYIVKEGQAEPVNYKNLPKQSIVKALTHFIIQQATTKKEEKIVNSEIVAEALHILSQKYSRPLPPLNWSFLHELIHKGLNIKEKCIAVAAKQAVISGTAKRLIDNFLVSINETMHDNIEIALKILADICNGASSDILKLFIEKTCTCAIDEDKIINLLSHEKDVTNRENLAMIISTFINRNSSEISVNVIKAIPSNILNMIHLMSAEKIRYRCEILKESLVENSVSWLNELIIEQLNKNECRELLMSSLENLLINTTKFPKKKWLSEFIILSSSKMVEKNLTKEDLQYILDIFITSIVAISGHCILIKQGSDRYQLFSSSVELISQCKFYDDIIGNIIEFILYVQSHEATSDEMIKIFKNAIVLSKDHTYFKKLSVWQKTLQAFISR
ncbi:hypothetical protein PVAND_008331 [Polypedilum vanderplanki]|uniref:DUF3730 domain-containing protein n=1 Tax=Polypedilum vanderplanki TaxID=319348 RepID=A0A9J6C9V8_POLVA|nr:hypothetical protein PVAND_008331 [Polypedilum vanderplanki]